MAEMKTSEHIAVTLEVFADAAFTIPAEVEGAIVWVSSDETVVRANITEVATGKTGFIEAVAAGKARMVWTGDADLGSGVVPLTVESEEITVTPDPAVAGFFKITLGAPEPKPAP